MLGFRGHFSTKSRSYSTTLGALRDARRAWRTEQARAHAGLPEQHRAPDLAELAAETRRFFRRRQRQPHIVRGYFSGLHVRYVLDENSTNF